MQSLYLLVPKYIYFSVIVIVIVIGIGIGFTCNLHKKITLMYAVPYL